MVEVVEMVLPPLLSLLPLLLPLLLSLSLLLTLELLLLEVLDFLLLPYQSWSFTIRLLIIDAEVTP